MMIMKAVNNIKKTLLHAAALPCIALVASPVWAADVEGSLDWVRRVELSTPLSGQVVKVDAEPGDLVKRGHALVELDARAFRVQLTKAASAVEQAELAQAEAQREEDRAVELYDRTVLSNRELELAKIGNATAKAELQASRSALTEAKLNLEYSVVRAPFDALVVARHVDAGQTVVTRLQATPLVVLAEAGAMKAQALVPYADLKGLSVGQAVKVEVENREYPGEITRLAVEPEKSEATPLYAVDVTFQHDPALLLRAGQRATVKLP